MTLDLAALEALIAKATPGPWGLSPCSGGGLLVTRPRPAAQTHLQIVPDHDAALIVAAVNALPELIARVRELERERDQTILNRACADALVSAARDMTQAAALAMRERCAKACDPDKYGVVNSGSAWIDGVRDGVRECAAAIRALEI